MDTFVDSSWYFLRYLSPSDTTRPFDPTLVERWLPTKLYVGGAEHAVLHLLYARFVMKALADTLELSVREPFQRLVNVGLVLASDGRKMSKSLGNIINPDDIVRTYGADSLRGYVLFMGPFSDAIPWQTRSLVGVRRWLDRVAALEQQVRGTEPLPTTIQRQLDRAIEKVTSDIERFHFNTAISTLMELTRSLRSASAIPLAAFAQFLLIVNPFAPHLTEWLWDRSFPKRSMRKQPWPVPGKSVGGAELITYIIQVNGKTRGTLDLPPTAPEPLVIERALNHPAVRRHLAGSPLRTIIVPGKLVNLVG